MKLFQPYRILLLFLVVAFTLVNCRKKLEIANWDDDVLMPVAEGRVNLFDLVKAKEIGADQTGLLHIRAKDTLLNIGLDSLVNIPDTAFTDAFSLPVAFPIFPGVPFYDSTSVTEYKIKNVQLTYAEVRESLFNVKVKNTSTAQILIRYTIPSATDDNGDTFKLERLIPAQSTHEEEFNLDGYKLDLRGKKKQSYNTIISTVQAMLDPAATGSHSLAPGKGFELENTFKEIIPQYARGYFGNQPVEYEGTTPLDIFNKLTYKAIDITEFEVNMIIDNGIGADLNLNIGSLGSANSLTGSEATLSHPIIGQTQQFGRALFLSNPSRPVQHVVKEISFTHENSNLDELLELNPTQLFYDLNMEVNPYGDISFGNDFVYYGHNLSAVMDVDIPVKIGIEGLVLRDTFDFLFEEANPEDGSERINHGFMRLYLDNGYPFSTAVQFYILDQDSAVIDSLMTTPQIMEAAPVDALGDVTSSVQSELHVPVDQDKIANLKKGRGIIFTAEIDTYQKSPAALYDSYSIGFKLIAELNVNVQ